MLRERATWFVLGAATTGVFAYFVVDRPRENPRPGVAQTVMSDGAAAITVAAPSSLRNAQAQSRDPRTTMSANAAQASQPASAAPPEAAPSVTAPNEPAAASPEEPLRAGQQLLARALDTGRWTGQDARALAAVSAELNAADRRELYGRLAVAINQDRIHVEKGFMPR